MKEEARLVARYLTEDNEENYIYFDPDTENELVIVKSIWRNFILLERHFTPEQIFELHTSLVEVVKNSKYNMEIETKRMDKPETLSEEKFLKFLKNTGMELNDD